MDINKIEKIMNNKSIILLLLLVLLGCEKGDGFAEFGHTYIYIPQSMVSGGIDNYYLVPAGGEENNYNFKIEDNKVNIILGVLRSGALNSDSYSVDVKSYAPSNEVLTSLNGIALPETIFTLPNTVNVDSEKTGEVFYLSVDATALKSETFNNQTLVLTVEISNPSNYELAEKGTKVNVVIDVEKIRGFLK